MEPAPLQNRPHRVQRVVDEVRHHIRKRRWRHTVEQRYLLLRRHDRPLRRFLGHDPLQRRAVDVGDLVELQIQLPEPKKSGARRLAGEVGNLYHERARAQLHVDVGPALDQVRRSGSTVLPDDVAGRDLVGVPAMLRVNDEAYAELGADRLGLGHRPADQIRRRDRPSANEEVETDVSAAAENQDDQCGEEEIVQAAAFHRPFHRCSGRSLFWCSALYSASSYLRESGRATYSGIRVSFQTSSTRAAKMKCSPFFTSSGTSVRSLRLPSGSTTVLMLARCAAITFSLMPPTESTLPRRVISPVMATSCRTGRSPITEAMQVAMATPAEGPSFGIAPAGK